MSGYQHSQYAVKKHYSAWHVIDIERQGNVPWNDRMTLEKLDNKVGTYQCEIHNCQLNIPDWENGFCHCGKTATHS